jgi:uncharacterized membrane protein SpoIIM required for sporulation
MFEDDMREAAFIQRNKGKWEKLERSVGGREQLSADEASDLYIQLTDDLSYARTYYPKSSILVYLNALASKLHQYVYRNKPTERSRLITFWTEEIPLVMASTRRELLLSFGLTLITALLGALSAYHDPEFVRIILGDDYVDQTLENIKNGTPMAIYGSQDEGDMFMFITSNNIRVSFIAFAMGMLFSLGTAYILLTNGFMLGAFQYFFFKHGAGLESVLSIWLHGTLEISAIIIAGSAGFTMGNAFLFPGTYPRTTSLIHGARKGLKIVIGLVPIFIMAGFIESFLTRHAPIMHTWVSSTIILGSLAYIIGYFIILPYHAERKHRAVAPRA